MCRKIAFFGLRAEIILSSDKVSLDSRAGPFLGVCRNIGFSEKYSPLPGGGGYELLFLADVICEHSAPKGAKTVGQKYVDMQ